MAKKYQRGDLAAAMLAELSAVCRETYVAYRQLQNSLSGERKQYDPGYQWDGGTVKRNGKEVTYRPIWPRLAAFMLEHRLEPAACIAYRCSHVDDGSRLYPNHLLDETWLKELTASCRVRGSSVAESLRNQVMVCTSAIMDAREEGLTRKQANLFVLLDLSLELSPLFRYCLLRAERLPKSADRFLAGAAVQFLRSPVAYTKHWGKWLPAGFAEMSNEAKQRAIALGKKQRTRRNHGEENSGYQPPKS